MPVVTVGGRTFSVRTQQEELALLQKEIEQLSPEELETLQILLKETEEGKADTYDTLAKLEYKRELVSMEQFVYDEYYLGNTCDTLFPRLLEDLKEIFSGGYTEIVLSGAIGYGKTFAASIGVCRMIYELSCLVNPHKSLGIAEGSNISIVGLSVNETLATKVVFENIATKISASQYFQDNFPFKQTKKELRFPGHVWVAARATTDASALGLNTIGAIVDECVTGKTKILLADGSEQLVEALGDKFQVRTFDFEKGETVVANATLRESSPQECFALKLSNGQMLRASGNHPVAIKRNQELTFSTICDIIDGDEILVFEPFLDTGTEKSSFGSYKEKNSGRKVCEQSPALVGGTEKSPFRTDEKGDSRGQTHAFTADGGNNQSPIWPETYGGGEGKTAAENAWAEGIIGNQSKDVSFPQREENSYRGIQETVSGEESDAKLQAYGRNEAKDFSLVSLDDPAGEVDLQRVRYHHESGSRGLPIVMGTARPGNFRGRPEDNFLYLRKAGSSLYTPGALTLDPAGLPVSANWWIDSNRRGETERLYLQREREAQASRRKGLLRGACLGVRGVGRELSMARVVSKERLGTIPTYDISVPGYEVYVADGVLVHNTNFIATSKADMKAKQESRPEFLYNQIKRRMKSRFMRGGGHLPTKMFIVSSKNNQDDFTAKVLRNAKTDPSVFARDYALWDVHPADRFSDERFHVLAGNDQVTSRILKPGEKETIEGTLPDGCLIVDVPEDFRGDFERDLDGSLRDLAGVATMATSPFISQRDKVQVCIETNREHPFSHEVWNQELGGGFNWGMLVEDVDPVRRRGSKEYDKVRPRINPKSPRHIHVDLGLTEDKCGFVMTHVAGWKDVERRTRDGKLYWESAPHYVVDFMLQVVPPPAGEINIAEIRRLIYELTDMGYPITTVTMDQWNSADMLQQLAQKGYKTYVQSVDVTMDPYDNLKIALYEGRVSMYPYSPLLNELFTLEVVYKGVKKKVDHPPTGAKDVADALAATCWTLLQSRSNSVPLPILPSIPDYGPDNWMPEQRQSITKERDNTILPPFILG